MAQFLIGIGKVSRVQLQPARVDMFNNNLRPQIVRRLTTELGALEHSFNTDRLLLCKHKGQPIRVPASDVRGVVMTEAEWCNIGSMFAQVGMDNFPNLKVRYVVRPDGSVEKV